jgi:catalase
MIMWVMSDRAIPRSLRFMEGFGVHTFRSSMPADESTFVKFHWKPKLGLQSVALERGGQDQRRRSRLPSPRPVGRDPAGQLPGMGAGVQLFDQAFADSSTSTSSTPPRSFPRRCCRPIPVGRLVLDRMPDNFFAETEQVAFMTQKRARHRLLQRSAAAGPQLLLSRHAAEAAGRPELHPSADQRAEVPVPHFQQDGHMAMRNPGRARQLPAELLARGRANRRSAASSPSPDVEQGPSAGCGRKALPTTTARPGSSTSARHRPSSATSPRR